MRVILEIQSGPHAGKKIEVPSGNPVRVGRSSRAEVVLREDLHMSGVHFTLEHDDKVCRFHDNQSTNGSLINGLKTTHTLLKDHDRIVAGETHFVVWIEQERAESPPSLHAPSVIPQERLLSMLRADFQPLFAILDAAREPSVLKVLIESREECESLFEGPQGGQLAHFAPYLVRLPADSPLIEGLVREGWGKSWGVYLTCSQPLKDLRRHLRHFLTVTLPGHREVYFRYYDPRVLRLFLPTCLPEEIDRFFGPIRYYLMEDEKAEALLRFSNSGQGVGLRSFPISSPLLVRGSR